MSENLMDELNSDSDYKTYNVDYNSSQCIQDNDSTSSLLNLIDQDILTNNQILGDSYSPNFAMSDGINNSNEQLAKPDVKSIGLDQNFEELLLTKLPQIVAIERASIQYQVIDQIYPSLSKSFQNCFNSPVLDLLVVVLDPNKLVSFFQGYFAGIPKLTNELIDLTGKYWKSFISNNDDTAWENHFKSVCEKYNSKINYESEFEAGPVIRCRLRASSNSQFNQQYNYFFVQPCSYIIQLPSNNFNSKSMDYNSMDINTGGMNNYFVSYINIVRECDTEYALKGSAAASLQKVITNSTYIQRQKIDVLDLPSSNKPPNNRNFRRSAHNNPAAINNQLSVNISSPAYTSIEQSPISANAPLTYPLINNHRSDQYNKSNIFPNAQMQHQMSQQRQLSIPMNHNQFITRGASISNVDPNQHRYSGPYDSSHSSSLQFILENRSNAYPNVKQLSNAPHLMGQHGPIYKSQIQPTYFLPTAQSGQQTCSLSSPNSFMSARHVIQMPSNSILMSSDQYFRSSHQINMMESVQVGQPMMTVVQPMSVTSNHSPVNYYYSTAQNQILHNPLHINTSLTNQSQFVSSSVSPYCNSDRTPMSHQEYSNTKSRNNPQTAVKQENYELNICQNDWLSNSVLDTRNSSLMSNNSISMDIVEEILQAEEAKFENKSLEIEAIKSDSSNSLIGYLNDIMPNNNNNNNTNLAATTPPISAPNLLIPATSPQLLNLDSVKLEGKISDFRCNKSMPNMNKMNNSQIKEEIMKNLDNSQRLRIKKIVNQFKCRKISKNIMLQQINDFLSQALGRQTYNQQVINFWKKQSKYSLSDNVDSSLSGFNYSSVVQSPEEGPGISPTEQAAQSTTDLEDDKDHNSKAQTNKFKDKTINDTKNRIIRSKSTTKNSEASIYSITSTTSTGVLETLLNEHDSMIISEKNTNTSNNNNITNSKSSNSTSKNQLSLDQLLMDDDLSMFANIDEKVPKKTPESLMRNSNCKITKSQPSTPLVTNSMGVLETLLNQKTPSMCTLRQMSTENILKHSIPSRQNSSDLFLEDSNYSFENIEKEKDKGSKKNSLLITLLNTSQNSEKAKMLNSLNSTSSMDCSSPNYTNKRSRMLSGTQSLYDNTTMANKKTEDKLVSPGVDVFDFVDTEMNFGVTDTQSTLVTSSQSLSTRKRAQTKRSRKRRYSKDRSVDSDESSDRLSSIGEKYMKTSVGSVKTEDKNVILTSLLENKKSRNILTPSTPGKGILNVEKSDNEYTPQTIIYENQIGHDDNLDLEDIKIDDFDLENLIDLSENFDESNSVGLDIIDQSLNTSNHQSSSDTTILPNKAIVTNSTMAAGGTTFDVMPPVYKMVGPIIKSDPIVPMSKQSILRVSDKNSILLSAIQSTSTSNSISFECLDSERERLLRQQQQQKVCMGGDKPPITMSHQLSLDMLSKQMKEVGPNVMVELSVPSEIPRQRKGSISRSQSGISTAPSSCNPSSIMSTSPTCRSSYQSSSTTDIPIDNIKATYTTTNQVNHQQVREGLRLLVSSRSAQNTSKNNVQINRTSSGNISEIVSQTEMVQTSKPAAKDIIHYTSNIQSSNSHKDPSYPYSNQSYISNINNTNEKTADILEDSLVNDVFGLEELVSSKSRHFSANLEYSRLNNQETISVESQMESSTYSTPNYPPNTPGGSLTQSKPPHHHHFTHHYHHHHHQHHHHHPVSNQPSINDSNITTTKEKQNVNSGLLETLLSR